MTLLFVLMGFLLAGCGGGGESSPSTVAEPGTPEPRAPVIHLQEAWENFIRTGYDLPVSISTARFVRDPVTHVSEIEGYDLSTGRASATPGVSSSFCTNQQTPPCPATWRVTETKTGLQEAFIEYDQDTSAVVMSEGPHQSSFVVYTPNTYPSTSQAGDAGALRHGLQWDTERGYRAVPGDGTLGRVSVSYRVAGDTLTTLAVTLTEYNASEHFDEQEFIAVYRVSTAGNVTPVSFSVRRFQAGETHFFMVMTF